MGKENEKINQQQQKIYLQETISKLKNALIVARSILISGGNINTQVCANGPTIEAVISESLYYASVTDSE